MRGRQRRQARRVGGLVEPAATNPSETNPSEKKGGGE
jgi:hypothetical protein